ncbi:restriction endonuclease subunit S [Rhodococcus sp. BP-241]|uniref:restriction endonuclease subunit S n=1 Tax=Rhodococcus sp. BP-241 TaxID=2739441 RepID=UPI0021BF38D8|nr:restriction endonuclease subunit S [Rhodococcus sp. BP-241]
MPAYPVYKDSGVRWLGRVPSSWSVQPINRRYQISLGKMLNGNISVTDGDMFPYLRAGNVQPRGLDLTEVKHIHLDTLERKSFTLLRGDLVVVEGGAGYGRSAVLTEDLTGWGFQNHIMRVRPRGGDSTRFLDYVIKTLSGNGHISTLSNHATIPSLSSEQLGRIVIPLPEEAEQDAIANFLDRETTKIHALMDKQNQLIATLREDRSATIAHAVTKGLNPETEMKDSGVEWLGAVPAHWITLPLKRLLAQPITDGPHETPEFLDEGIEFISAEAVSTGKVIFDKRRGFISHSDHLRYSAKYSPRLHDIFVIKSGATTGVAAIVTDEKVFDIWSPLAAIRPTDQHDPFFVLNFIRSDPFQRAIALSWTYGTQQNLGMGTLGNLHVAVPPFNEQRQIASLLEVAVGKIDALIDKATEMISTLREYQSALISAVVTGKIDVREAA